MHFDVPKQSFVPTGWHAGGLMKYFHDKPRCCKLSLATAVIVFGSTHIFQSFVIYSITLIMMPIYCKYKSIITNKIRFSNNFSLHCVPYSPYWKTFQIKFVDLYLCHICNSWYNDYKRGNAVDKYKTKLHLS